MLLSYPAFSADTIGDIVEQTGIGNIIREGNKIPSSNMPSINLYDEAQTGNGRMLIEFLDAEELEQGNFDLLQSADAILVPGGFGSRGFEGKIAAARYARENRIPYLGICYGLHAVVIDLSLIHI